MLTSFKSFGEKNPEEEEKERQILKQRQQEHDKQVHRSLMNVIATGTGMDAFAKNVFTEPTAYGGTRELTYAEMRERYG